MFNIQENPCLNQATQKYTCQNFPTQQKSRNRKFQTILRTSPSLEIRSTPRTGDSGKKVAYKRVIIVLRQTYMKLSLFQYFCRAQRWKQSLHCMCLLKQTESIIMKTEPCGGFMKRTKSWLTRVWKVTIPRRYPTRNTCVACCISFKLGKLWMKYQGNAKASRRDCCSWMVIICFLYY